ncbi:hypothetical protein TRIATDRAFT_284830 [Trichoderma atroviride IMI 206040]|uniref:Uncharacterized protein n=1 Tax=Hypocrea atroviridis (strain ATCC 20476 / IMI 206040) TaxID=452589 RepID=G9P078_HYPAI|nr:uncharacterized protein TRIATDRAFT_284830 [Trichoderma atroviride IMI 206040]EHK44123.1 hypothetical protein TRIATDRAFT_284830 [Trichoderma atroviride IMI 206040]
MATRIGTLKMLHETRQAGIASKIEIPSHRLQHLFAASKRSNTQTSNNLGRQASEPAQSWAPKQTRRPKNLNKQNRMLHLHSTRRNDDTLRRAPPVSATPLARDAAILKLQLNSLLAMLSISSGPVKNVQKKRPAPAPRNAALEPMGGSPSVGRIARGQSPANLGERQPKRGEPQFKRLVTRVGLTTCGRETQCDMMM